MLEREFQALVIKKIQTRLPESRIEINDPNLAGQQGIPDLTIFNGPKWAFLEVKASAKAKFRPNQQYWLDKWSVHTFCAVIYPENETEVLDALCQALRN